MTFDGDGRIAKRLNRSANWFVQPVTWAETPEYNIYSSVTGQKITELTQTGQKLHTYVYMGSTVIADQNYGTQSNSELTFKHTDPATGSVMQTQLSGELSANGTGRIDSAGLGTFVPAQEGEEFPMPDYKKGGSTANPEQGCPNIEPGANNSMPCNVLRSLANHLSRIYGYGYLRDLARPDIGLGSGGVGADNQPSDGHRIPGLRLVRDRNGFAIKGFDFRFSWVIENGPDFIDLKNDPPEVLLTKYNYFKSFIERRVIFVGDPTGLVMGNREGLISRLAWLVGLKDCNDEFKRKLGKTPFDVLKERTLYITDYASLANPAHRAALGLATEDVDYLIARRDSRSPIATTKSEGYPLGILSIFNEKEISVHWAWNYFGYGHIDEGKLDEAVPHEMIHMTGKGEDPFPNPMSRKPLHDLSGWDAYSRVIDTCKIPLSR